MYSVYLSPSAQQNNKGVANYKNEELRANEVCDIVEKELKRHNVKTYRNNKSMNLTEIVKDSNDKKANIHQAIHTNAFNQNTRGCECFCHKFGGKGHKLSNLIYNNISRITPTSDRGVKEGFNFYGNGKSMYELAYTSMPASLVEIIFHDNFEDVAWFLKNIENIGIEIAKGILSYFDIIYIQEKLMYSVQSGVFKNKNNATNLIKYLNMFGVDGIIVQK